METVWLISIIIVIFFLYKIVTKKLVITEKIKYIINKFSRKQTTPEIKILLVSEGPTHEEWEASKEARQESINKLISGFSPPSSMTEAFAVCLLLLVHFQQSIILTR